MSADLTPALRRLRRRELHRSRSAASSTALVLLAIALAYVGTECVLAALGRPALLVAPADALATFAEPARPWAVPAAAALAILGIAAIALAVAPGRRPRHVLHRERFAVLVDDDVLAGAISRRAATVASISRDQVSTAVSGRDGSVALRPTSGFPVDSGAVATAATALVRELAVVPVLRTRVRVDDRAVIAR